MRVFDIGAKDGPQEASDRIWTIPNALSLARLLVLPLIYLDLVDGRLTRAFVLLVVFAATDWLDGYLARRLDQISRLGTLLDPISDRALFLVVGIAFVVAGLLPVWALLLIVVRDVAVLLVGGALLVAGRTPPAVTRIGKAATFGLMWAFPIWLVAAMVGGGAAEPQVVLAGLGWVVYAVSVVLYYVSAGQYAVEVARRPR
ncbi:MAG: CDP-alcohol phosphatidyltransferase family protein [Nitriliruptoraceae bacterium]